MVMSCYEAGVHAVVVNHGPAARLSAAFRSNLLVQVVVRRSGRTELVLHVALYTASAGH